MALEKFHYEFKDGTKVELKKFTNLSFSAYRKMIQATEEDQQQIMIDVLLDSATPAVQKKIDSQPFMEILTEMIPAWQEDANNEVQEIVGEDVDPK